jgi:hypothetical protein
MKPNAVRIPFPHPGDQYLELHDLLGRGIEYADQVKAAHPDCEDDVLRGRFHRPAREAFMAMWFAYAFAGAHRISNLKVQLGQEERTDADARFRWTEGGKVYNAPVQLKELMPITVNAIDSIERLVKDACAKYPNARDLIVAIYVNRSGPLDLEIRVPSLVAQLWCWGFSKPNAQELFLSGTTHSGSRHFRVGVDLSRPIDQVAVWTKTSDDKVCHVGLG